MGAVRLRVDRARHRAREKPPRRRHGAGQDRIVEPGLDEAGLVGEAFFEAGFAGRDLASRWRSGLG